ncbi:MULTISPECIES: AAA family ATPase [unclassified Olsenella]|uniref:McrB family protein n=1 Tax=unclassified Olsenella TaxID=2638792 RepID=UPI00068D1B30|nr:MULTISPECIES: AAA family ATPase [unclassified Olsenella]
MTTPVPYKPTKPLDPRLVTKTSLRDPKKAIAALILLWYAKGKPGETEYGKNEGVSTEGGILDDDIVNSISELLRNHGASPQNRSLRDLLAGNALFTSQLEALNAAFELVWHMASFNFLSSSNRGKERTGGKRFRKRIAFSTNMDLIDVIAGDDLGSLLETLLDWLAGNQVSNNKSMEMRLIRALTAFSEVSFYKTGKGSSGEIYNPIGIYTRLIGGDQTVSTTDGDEAQGPTRILNSALQDGLNPYLTCSQHNVSLAPNISSRDIDGYAERAATSLRLSNIEIDAQQQSVQEEQEMADAVGYPHNLIFFGAPGTGKSYQLNRIAQSCFPSEHVRRVTFYPDYTYSQFVGSFKPVTRYADPKDDEPLTKEKPYISYEFVPGPFLSTYISAVQNPSKNYLLIVEEINRANPAAVFGDIFQLLDRKPSGRSEYEIAVPKEMEDYLRIFLPQYATNAYIQDPSEILTEQERLAHEEHRLSLPPNMYIWATMNSADQGVFPMDTAFKRRWDFRYMGIDEGDHEPIKAIDDMCIDNFVVTIAGVRVHWNGLRKALNDLMRDARINEDKLLGPFFLAPSTLNDDPVPDGSGTVFQASFKDKVLLYLYEDAGKMHRPALFADDKASYSEICDKFDSSGVAVFKGIDISSILEDSARDDANLPNEE